MTSDHVSAVFVDTNVLLTATSPARPLHAHARHVLEGWPNQGCDLCISAQVVREYLSVATRPLAVNGLGLESQDALRNARAIAARCRVLEESRAVLERLLTLLSPGRVSGRQVHDANIAATMLEHGVNAIVTDDDGHFRAFDLEVIALEAADKIRPVIR